MVGEKEYTRGGIAGGWVHISKGKIPIALVHPKYVNKFLAVPRMYKALEAIATAQNLIGAQQIAKQVLAELEGKAEGK